MGKADMSSVKEISHKNMARAAEMLLRASSAVAFTGAGISVASGIPDYRSPGGVWSRWDPLEVASARSPVQNPKKFWEFLLDAGRTFNGVKPNPAHIALAQMEERGLIKGIVTQNIDGLHTMAGSKKVVEYHGNGKRWYCNSCHKEHAHEDMQKVTAEDIPVLCDECGGVVRPAIVLYGESIPPEAMLEAEFLAAQADLAFVIGTSGEVAPFNSLAPTVKEKGGHVIEINLGPSANTLGLFEFGIYGPAENILPKILELTLSESAS
jgi:NAD-dependent deacetylase